MERSPHGRTNKRAAAQEAAERYGSPAWATKQAAPLRWCFLCGSRAERLGRGVGVEDEMTRTRRHVGGFTLAEAVLAAAVLAMTVSAIILPFSASVMNQQAEARITMATCLAEEMMEEILSKPFRDPDGSSSPGPESGESARDDFDNMDDYHGYSESAGGIISSQQAVITDPAATGLSRSVSVDYVYVSGQDTSADPTFLRVEVKVLYRGQDAVALTRLVYCLD